MGKFLSRIADSAVTLIRSTIGPLPDDAFFMKSIRQLIDADNSVQQPYKNSVWVYASINAIAQNAANVPIKFFDRDGNEEPKTGPYNMLLKRPNYMYTRKMFVQAIYIFLETYGECYILLDRDSVTEFPRSMYVVSPTKFKPIIDTELNTLLGWEYTVNGVPRPLPVYQVAFVQYVNPYDPWKGLSPLEAARLGVNQDYFASKYNESFFKNGARVGGFITVQDDLDDTKYNRYLSQFEDRHSGYAKAHRIGILDNGATFAEAKLSQKDMDFVNTRKMSREEVFAVYKVNEVVLGLYDEVQSYEGIKMAHRSFWEECMVPRMSYVEDYLNSMVFEIIAGGKTMKFDLASVGALHEDYSSRIDTAKKMVYMGWPLNEVNKRLELGMTEQPWGDEWWVPMGLTPVSQLNKEIEEAADEDDNDDTDIDGTEDSVVAVEDTTESDKRLWSHYLSVQSNYEDIYRRKLKRFFFEQRKSVLDNLYNDIDMIVNVEKETKRLSSLLKSLYMFTLVAGADMINKELGNDDVQFSSDNKNVLKYIELRLSTISARIVNSFVKQLNKILAKNRSKEDTAELVRNLYNKVPKRVNIISRTESSSVLVVGRVIHMQRRGVTYHKWVTSRHESGRESHMSYNGKVVKLGESFSNEFTLRYPGDLSAPASESVLCRCFTVMTSSVR